MVPGELSDAAGDRGGSLSTLSRRTFSSSLAAGNSIVIKVSNEQEENSTDIPDRLTIVPRDGNTRGTGVVLVSP